MKALTRSALGSVLALAAWIAYGATLWLVAIHVAEGSHERSEPGFVAHWLRDGTLALPGVVAVVLLAVAVVERLHARSPLPDRWRWAAVVAGSAAGSAVVLAAGNPVHGLLFDAHGNAGLSAELHLLRDTVIGLAAALPSAAGYVLLRGRAIALAPPAAPAPRPLAVVAVAEPAPGRAAATAVPATGGTLLTRRAVVGYGAASVAVAGVGLSSLSRPARANPVSDRLEMFINEGHVAMVDGALVYMRGFGGLPSGDPNPSLTISPTVFVAGGSGPVDSHSYPLVTPDRLPQDGIPASAGPDPLGGNLISRRHWASFFPDRTIVAESGSQIRLRITNRLAQPHAFEIDGVVKETFGPAGSPAATKDVVFDAPAPGTYIYHDPTEAPVNRVLGLHGVLVVVPADNPWSFDGSEGEFERQFLWILHDIDPEWGRRAQMGVTIDPAQTPCLPRYFTMNDRAGVYSSAVSPDEALNHRTLEDIKPGGHVRRIDVRDFSDPSVATGQLVRIVNTGVATHQPHFHGNHVWTLVESNKVLSRSQITVTAGGHPRLQLWEDVVQLDAMQTKAVMLPLKRPPDVLDEVFAAQQCEYLFPMHCHAEMSQTAAGGLYPGGQVTDWRLLP
jgi:hypothetical protein